MTQRQIAVYELAWGALWADMDAALRDGHWRLASLISDAAWSLCHCHEWISTGDPGAARAALQRVHILYAEIEALVQGNAVV